MAKIKVETWAQRGTERWDELFDSFVSQTAVSDPQHPGVELFTEVVESVKPHSKGLTRFVLVGAVAK